MRSELSFVPKEAWQFLANFGDLAVLGPAALAVFVLLLVQRQRPDALAWIAGFGICFVATLAMKAAFGSFRVTLLGHVFNAASFPSGHVALSTAFYGGLATLTWSATRSWIGRAVAAGLAALVPLVALAVVALSWHHTLDVAVGFLVGLVSVLLMHRYGLARPRGPVQLATILLASAVLIGATHGLRLDDHVGGLKFAGAAVALHRL
jgi:membrane-associated phospholipid phosphatase